MRKDIHLHFLTNLKQTKWGLLITLLILVFFVVTSLQPYYTGMDPIEYVLEDRLEFNTLLLLILLTPIFIMVLMMTQNYRFTKTRWLLMRKDRRVYILGDILFLFCMLLIGWILCLFIIYYKYDYQLGELKKYEVVYQNIPSFMEQIKNFEYASIIYPTHALEWVIKPINLLCISTFLGYLVNVIAMGNKDKVNMMICISLIVVFYLIRYMESSVLVFIILLIIAIISYKLSIKIWSIAYTGGSHAEN